MMHILEKKVHCIHCLQEKIENATFCKDYLHCLQPICIMLQCNGTITYLMTADNIFALDLQISGYIASVNSVRRNFKVKNKTTICNH